MVSRGVHVAAAFVLLTYYWLVVRLWPRRVLRRVRGGRAARVPGADATPRARLNAVLSAVARASDLHPLRPRCLEQALTAHAILAAWGEPAVVVIGIRTTSEFAAHAWVEVGPLTNDAARPAFVELTHLP
jgi:hypothetical protein